MDSDINVCLPTKEYVEQVLRDAVKAVVLDSQKSISSSSLPLPSDKTGLCNPTPAKKPRNEIFHCIFGDGSETVTEDAETDEVTEYLRMRTLDQEDSPLRFWSMHMSKFPALYKLARAYLAMPASSAGVERLFSTAGAIGRARRARITTEKMEMLLTNRQYLYNTSSILKSNDPCDTEILEIPEQLPEGVTEGEDTGNTHEEG